MFVLGMLFVAALAVQPAPQTPAPSEQLAPAVAALVRSGDKATAQRDLESARAAYAQADSKSHHTCVLCLMRLASAYRGLGQSDWALDALHKAERIPSAPGLASAVRRQDGQLRFAMAGYGHPGSKDLVVALAAFQAALALTPGDTGLRYDLGMTLLRQGNDAAGVAELKLFLADPRADPRLATDARADAARPALAREPFAPSFSIPTDSGATISLAGLQGKVVLLDFWASWCPPCQMSTPAMVALHKKFASRSDFAMVGINDDHTAADARAYMAKHHMVWPDSFDGQGQTQTLFQISGIPTFIVLDRLGVVRFRRDGWSDDFASAIEEAVKKALKAKPANN